MRVSDPALTLLEDLGKVHEAQIVEDLQRAGQTLTVDMKDFSKASLEKAAQDTRDAMQAGIPTIIQACLYTGDFVGYADFLILAKDPNGDGIRDAEGRYIYNPVDAKSARSEKRSAILQVATYAHIMREMGLATPLTVHLWLGGENEWSAPASDLMDLAEEFITRVRSRIQDISSIPTPIWEAPKESCTRCRWKNHCEKGRIAADDISLTQGIRSTTRLALIQAGLNSMPQLAGAGSEDRPRSPKEVSEQTFKTLVAQASIQVRGRKTPDQIINEPKDLLALGLLPEPSNGDIWFDMEGDPFGENGDGLEYMFGWTFLDINGEPDFKTFEAIDRASEKIAFSQFIEMVVARKEQFPDLHIYHYAAYEPSRMRMLSQRHGILEREVDHLLRTGTFIDLYSIVRKAMRFSSDSMSIKDVEQIYQGKRVKDEGVTTAVDSVLQFEAACLYLNLGEEKEFEKILAEIRKYNKVDCDSTRQLDIWLRKEAQRLNINLAEIRLEAEERFAEPEEVLDPVALQLLEGVQSNPNQRTEEEQAIALLASAVSFHWRESKPAWWNILDLASSDLEDLEGAEDAIVGTHVRATPWSTPPGKRNLFRTLTFKVAGTDLSNMVSEGDTHHLLYDNPPESMKSLVGTNRAIKLSRGVNSINGDSVDVLESVQSSPWDELPIALLPEPPIRTDKIQSVLRDELGGLVISRKESTGDIFPKECWADLLLRRRPRQRSNSELCHSGDEVRDITESLLDSDNSYVAVQGPPGTGKTYVGSHVIAALAKQGWKIGVTGQSHAVIENILDGVRKLNSTIPISKEVQGGPQNPKPYHVPDLARWANSQAYGFVIGGTVWTFARSNIRDLNLDLIVIDEAGQFSLANTLAVSSAARCALLLGDPQQLPQVSQASHPEPVEISVLTHLMGESKTISPEIGYFLQTTYRLHPKLCRFVSLLQYDGKLQSAPVCSQRILRGVEPGLHVIQVDHEGNTTQSSEEAERILTMIPDLIGRSWGDISGSEQIATLRVISQKDIIIVTAYNRQVRYINSLLRSKGLEDVRVGTFDKFQGQEAPIVFVSIATSSSEDLPRGMEFLLSPNRLNVAISRAKWVCYLVRSPQLSRMEPASAKGMVYLGKFIALCKG